MICSKVSFIYFMFDSRLLIIGSLPSLRSAKFFLTSYTSVSKTAQEKVEISAKDKSHLHSKIEPSPSWFLVATGLPSGLAMALDRASVGLLMLEAISRLFA